MFQEQFLTNEFIGSSSINLSLLPHIASLSTYKTISLPEVFQSPTAAPRYAAPMNAFVPTSALPLGSGLSTACGRSVGTSTTSSSKLPVHVPARRQNGVGNGMVMMCRKFMVGGNWKCNLNTESVKALVSTLNGGAATGDAVDVVVAPPSPYLYITKETLRSDFALGAQDAWISTGGAFTGEVDATMLLDIGCDWLIVGHSERRHTAELKESDATCAQKARRALDVGLKVIFCVGELLDEREAGTTVDVCTRQLDALADVITPDEWENVVVAYEPVWAIGTGKVATPEQADETHKQLRNWLGTNITPIVATNTRILYGGSVNAKNCADLAKCKDIDGFLVGGASLKPEFLDIVDAHKLAAPAAV